MNSIEILERLNSEYLTISAKLKTLYLHNGNQKTWATKQIEEELEQIVKSSNKIIKKNEDFKKLFA